MRSRATAIEMDGKADRSLSPGILDLLGRQQVSSSHTDRQQNVPHVHLFSGWTDDNWKLHFKSFILQYYLTGLKIANGPLD